jgi:hypothetical protein
MYYEGEGTEDSYAYFPPMDEAVEFDLSRYEDGRLRWKNGDQWLDFYYGGATMEEAAPPLS